MTQWQVYISYDRRTGFAFARQVNDVLRERGIRAWMTTGEISELKDTHIMVIILTSALLQSPINRAELQLAQTAEIPLIIALADDLADEDLPPYLQSRPLVSFMDSFARGMSKLETLIHSAQHFYQQYRSLKELRQQLDSALSEHRQPARLQARIRELDEQLAMKRRFITDTHNAIADYRRAIQIGIEEEREHWRRNREQIRNLTRQRVVGTPPQIVEHYKARESETTLILNTLLTESSPYTMVSLVGRGGAGKTTLACKIMQDLEREIETVYGLIYLSTRLGLGITLEQIYLSIAQSLGEPYNELLNYIWTDESLSDESRLDSLLSAMRGKKIIILLDNLEDLLDDQGCLKDRRLQIFFESFLPAKQPSKLLVTSRRPLQLPSHIRDLEQIISLDQGLSPEFAISLLRDFDSDDSIGIKSAEEATLRQLVNHSGGFPRALEAIVGIMANNPLLRLEDLLTWDSLTGVEQWVRIADEQLDTDARIVLQALAVYGRPVTETAIRMLLEPYIARFGLDVGATLRRLLRGRYIALKTTSGEIIQHPLDRDYYYQQIPTDLQQDYNLEALERRAGNYYVEMRLPSSEWRHIADLEPQLAEFDHRIRARDYHNAARLINMIDYHYLSLWGHVRRVAHMREQLIGHLTDPQLDSVNSNNLGLCYSSLGRYDEAIQFYERALAIDEQYQSRGDVAVTLANLGTVYSNKGDIRKAIEHQERALAIFRELGFRRNEGITVSLLGQNYHTLGMPDKAIEYYTDALQIAREVENRIGEGVCLSNLGNLHYDLGNPSVALDYYQQALDIARETGDKRSFGGNLNNIGNIYSALGDLPKALDYYQQSLNIAREIGDRASEGYRLSNIGDLHTLLGNYEEAIAYHQQALAMAEEVGSLAMKSTALGGLGWIYSELRLLSQALAYYQQSLDIVRQMGDRYGECNRLGNLGSIYTDMGQHEIALNYHQQSLAIAREIGEPTNECMRLAWLGWTYFDMGDNEQAIELLEEGLQIARRIGNKRWEENNRFALAWVFTVMGHYETAQQYINQCLALARVMGNPSTLQSRESLRGELAFLTEKLEEALTTVNHALSYPTPPVKRRTTLLLRGHILARLRRWEEARADYEQVLLFSDDAIAQSPDLFSARYSRGQALVGLALITSGDQRRVYLQAATKAFAEARKNCPARGVINYNIQLLDKLSPIDQGHILEAIRAMLINGQ